MENLQFADVESAPALSVEDAAPQEPAVQEQPEQSENTTADCNENGLTVRYNHCDVKLSLSEAKALAQKGMKYDALKLGADEQPQNSSLAEKIADSLLQLQQEFEEVTCFDSLPDEVKTEALQGGDLLKSYLLYRHRQQLAAAKSKADSETAASVSTGRLKDSINNGFVDDAFIQGLYN